MSGKDMKKCFHIWLNLGVESLGVSLIAPSDLGQKIYCADRVEHPFLAVDQTGKTCILCGASMKKAHSL